jgi:hypothetical protein
VSRREQIITATLGIVVLVLGVVLYLNQDTNNTKTKVLGEQLHNTSTTKHSNTTVGVPGIEQSTSTTTTTTLQEVPDTGSSVSDEFTSDVTSAPDNGSGSQTQNTTVVTHIVTSIIPPDIPMPDLGPVSLTSDNTAAITYDNGSPTITSSEVLNNGALTTFTIGITQSSNNVFIMTVSLFNKSGATLNLGPNGTININVTDNNGHTLVKAIPLGNNSSVQSFQQLTASTAIALNTTGSYSINATTSGAWQ